MRLSFSVVDPPKGLEKDLPPIVLLHGMLDSKKSWETVAPKLAEATGRRVYYLDARNHGESPWTEDFSFQFMADDVEQFINEQEIPKAVVIGSSMGGNVAMKLALDLPALVDKLVVEDMVPEPFPTHGWKIVIVAILMLRKALLEIPEDADPIAAKAAITKFLNAHLPHMTPNQNHEFGLQVMPLKQVNGTFAWETNLDTIESVLLTNPDFDRGLSGTFSGETLFLYGTESYMKVGEDSLIPSMFPRAVRVPVEGATHMIHFEMPEEFVKKVAQFINGENSEVPES